MPQLITYIDKDLRDALDAKVQEIKDTTGINISRSALVTAVIRDFLTPKCTEKSTTELQKDQRPAA